MTANINALLADFLQHAIRIESASNSRINSLSKLKTRRARSREGKFLIEGQRELARALAAKVSIETLLICPDVITNLDPELNLDDVPDGMQVLSLSEAAFNKLSLRQSPDGVMGVARWVERQLDELMASTDELYLVIDGLEKPGNIGALLRTADSVNVTAVFVTGQGTDLENPNVIRASMGSVFSRPVLQVDDIELGAWFKQHQVKVVAASPHSQHPYWQLELTQAVAIVLGTEHEGLSEYWQERASEHAVIPMYGQADSLNVATSGALLLYEALRQRSS
ncbi:MAG: RNA methyltransferase [Deinococcota bacterium]